MNYDHPKQPIDGSFAPLGDTFWEMKERQKFADMQRGSVSPLSDAIEDICYPERKAQRVQAELERRREEALKEAESMSMIDLLKEIYVMLKMKNLVI